MAHFPTPLNKYLIHPIQAAAAYGAFTFFRLLPLDWASGLGGGLMRVIGPRLRLSNRARNNLGIAFPDMDPPEIERIVRAMWDNLGRTAGEFPHMNDIDVYGMPGRIEVVGAEHVDQLRQDGRPGIVFSGHFANWEIIPLCVTQRGLPLDRVYREANNRLVEWLYRYGRSPISGELIPKGRQGVRQLLKVFTDGGHLGMMIDQKMNDGIPVPFFGRDAMTAPAIAELALRFDCPVLPLRLTRLQGARFRYTIEAPFVFEKSGDAEQDIVNAMARINDQIEAWVRDTPEQWLWLHNRWPSNPGALTPKE